MERRPTVHESIDALEAKRVAAGTCRHCGGRVPCWSLFGDAEVGKRWNEIPEAERRRLENEYSRGEGGR